MKVLGTIEARMGSSRLPGKILMEICGQPVLKHIYDRLRQAKKIDEVVVATTTNIKDDETAAFCRKYSIPHFRGSENDITSRLIDTAREFGGTHIVQMTGDCPFIDPTVVDRCISLYQEGHWDYVSNRLRPSYPCGLETQMYSVDVLNSVKENTSDPNDLEHGSYFIYTHPEIYRLKNFSAEAYHCPEKRWVLDYPEDFEFTKTIYENLYPKNPNFTTDQIFAFLQQNPEVEKINQARGVIVRNYI